MTTPLVFFGSGERHGHHEGQTVEDGQVKWYTRCQLHVPLSQEAGHEVAHPAATTTTRLRPPTQYAPGVGTNANPMSDNDTDSDDGDFINSSSDISEMASASVGSSMHSTLNSTNIEGRVRRFQAH